MAGDYEAKVQMQYCDTRDAPGEDGVRKPRARMTVEYFELDMGDLLNIEQAFAVEPLLHLQTLGRTLVDADG